jgi:hypothetical protein
MNGSRLSKVNVLAIHKGTKMSHARPDLPAMPDVWVLPLGGGLSLWVLNRLQQGL